MWRRAAGGVVPTLRLQPGRLSPISEGRLRSRPLSGLGLEAQRATVAAYAERKGVEITGEYCDEGISAKSLKGRPAALAALEAVRAGSAAGMLVAKMDRLSRSVVDGAGLMERAAREGWTLHFADLDLDTSTPAGEMAANIIISGSQYERRLISQRTRDALAAKRARGERLGAAPALPLEVTRRILAERANGRTFQAIADGLMSTGFPLRGVRRIGFRRPLRLRLLATTPPRSRSGAEESI
jgi:DNA invertase Pin-like site-specific DNA recombinase